jgi:NAD(P)-dependent dehydrogenase (short-subunit alcohol dehydrogenase family)
MNMKGKTAVVTGGGNGIGRQLCLLLLEKGARVAAVDIREEWLEETKAMAAERADRLSLHVADITDRQRVCSLPDEISARHGAIHLLVNNAGIIQPFVPFSELEFAQIQRVININVYGPMLMIRSFLPFLADAPQGYIANVSSMGGFLPVPGQTLYGASKAAIKLLTEGLRAELSNTNIGVSVIFPGGIATNITGNSGVAPPMGSSEAVEKQAAKLTTPAEAAAIIVGGIEKEKARILVGRDAKIMDFFSRMAPARAGRMMARMMSSMMSGSFSRADELKAKGCPDGDE